MFDESAMRTTHSAVAMHPSTALAPPVSLASARPQKNRRASSRPIRTKVLIGSAGAYRAEMVRVLALAAERCEWVRALRIDREARACNQFEALWQPGAAVIIAERAGRVEGILQFVPQLLTSAFLERHFWRVGCLAAVSEDRAGVIQALTMAGLADLEPRVELVEATVPACDANGIRGLERAGFEVVCGAALMAADPRRIRRNGPPAISIEPLPTPLPEALGTITGAYSHFAWDFRISSDKLNRLIERELLIAMREPDVVVLVARDSSGQVAGLALASTADESTERRSRVGVVRFVGVRPDSRGHGISEALHVGALMALDGLGAHVVTTQPMLKDEASVRNIRSLTKIGYRLATSSLVLHQWHGSSSAQAHGPKKTTGMWDERGPHGVRGTANRA